MASNAWEKVAEVDEGIIFSGELVNLGRQSLAREIEVRLPRLSGSVSQFRIRPSSFFSAESNNVRVYEGASGDEENARLHMVVSGGQFFAQILARQGVEYIDPISETSVKVYAAAAGVPPSFSCLAEPLNIAETPLARQSSNPEVVRTFRLAGAATAEFTAFHGSKEAAFLSLVTALNRAHGIFERELGIRFQLVPQSESMVFTDPASDPYTTNEPGYEMLRDAHAAFDDRIGTSNYDLGIVLTRGTYGLTYIRSVCDPERKGSSCVGLPEPTGDAFHVNLVTHELAHQFGANHTFNSPSGFCAERRNLWTAFEPGAGSTIMSYASLPCEGDSFQARNDAYFHSENLKEISNFLNNPQAACGQVELLANRPPAVSVGGDRHIPARTPFSLTAVGSDPDGDAITYCWEQRDLGPSQVLGAPDNGFSPLFRSYPPSPSPTRIFPALPFILSGEQPDFEQLPSTDRLLRFRVTARDSSGLGGFSWADTQLGVIDTGSPFQVTSHSEPATLSDPQTEVRWDVSGTTASPINVANVRITLSLDGGESFSHVLAESTPNDGVETVGLPPVNTSQARIKVEAVGNVFFSINRAPLSLVGQGTSFPKLEWRWVNGELVIQWPTKPGLTYRVERAADLKDPDWQEVERRLASGSHLSMTVPSQFTGVAFFRVVEE